MRDTAWVSVTVVHTTDKAALVKDGDGTEAWIPLRAILDSSDDIVKGESIDIEISRTMAEDKGIS